MKDVWQAIGTIIAAVIAAIALLRVNKIDNQDKIRRGLWSMETYLFLTGNYLADPTNENRAKYKSCYFVCMFYIHESFRDTLFEIDKLLEQKKWEDAEIKIIELMSTYTSIYSMQKYRPRRCIKIVIKNIKTTLSGLLKRKQEK